LRRLALLVLLTAIVVIPAAHADGDPASDYLLGLQSFVPPDAGFSKTDSERLTRLLSGARQGTPITGAAPGGYTIRVAVIASRYDLGSVTILDKKPRLYAHFLSQELRFVYKKRLLVVMPNGYGIARDGKPDPTEQKVLDRLPRPAATHGPELAAATERAVRALTKNAGVRIAAVSIPAPKSSGSGDTTTRDRIVIVAGALALLCAVLVAGIARRRR
jgi:hypothetical protein